MSGLQKNVASQKWRVFAFDVTDGTAKTGDAANISAKIAKDWAAAGATDDVAPTEVEDGYYLFNLTQAETNADVLDLYPESSTANIQVVGVPGTIFTEIKQTGDNFARLGAPAGASIAADLVVIDNFVDGLETTIGTAGDGLTAINLPNQTMDIAGSITGSVSGSVGSVTGSVGSVVGHTAQTGDSFARIGAAGVSLTDLGGMSATMKAQVNTEVDGALDTTIGGAPTAGSVNDVLKDVDARLPASGTLSTFDETAALTLPGQEAPTATPTAEEVLAYLFKAWRNRVTQTATEYSLYADDATTVDHKAAVSDNGTTFDKGEVGTGA